MSKNTMLIVEDSEIERDILQYIFKDKYSILVADNGKSALKILNEFKDKIDVILSDLVMPEMDGLELLECKNKLGPPISDIPTVMITSDERKETQIKAFKNKAKDYITKPFEPDIVAPRVDNVVESCIQFKALIKENENLVVKTEIDEMTSLYNKATTEYLSSKFLSDEESGLCALILIDVDNFKSVNDKEGHLVGDHVLEIISAHIKKQFRNTDIVGRVGGDEFLVLMKDLPDKDVARLKANQLVQNIKRKNNMTIPSYVSVSIGLAFCDACTSSYDEVFKTADELLHKSKDEGRARVTELGEAQYFFEQDERNIILLLTLDRDVSGTVQFVLGQDYRIIEIDKEAQMLSFSDKEKQKIILGIVDISMDEDDGKRILDNLSGKNRWFKNTSFIAVCRESNMKQLANALKFAAADIVTTPIDVEVFKRRVYRHLKDNSKLIHPGGTQ